MCYTDWPEWLNVNMMCNETAAYFLLKNVNFLTDVSCNTIQVSSIRCISVINYLFELVTSDKQLAIGQSRNRTSI